MASRESFKKYVGEKNGTYTNSRDTFKDYVNSGDAEKSRKRREEYKQQEQQKRQQTAGTTASEKSTSNTVEINGQQYKKVDIDFDAINHDVLYRNDRSDYDSTNYNSVVAKPPEKVEHPTKWTYKDNLEYIPEWQEYHMSLSDEEKNELEREKIASEAYRYAEEHPVLATMAQVGLAPSAMLGSSAGMLYESTKKNVADIYNRDPIWNKVFEATNKAYLNMGEKTGSEIVSDVGSTLESSRKELSDYKGIDPNNPLFMLGERRESMQQGVTDNVDVKIGSKDVFDLAYGAGMSMVDSATAMLIPGGSILLGTTAAASTMREAKRKGLSDEQAMSYALISGVAEMVFEEISIGKFKALQEVSPAGLKDIVRNILKSSGVNASEELVTEAVNVIYDTLAHGEKSDYNIAVKRYIEASKTPEEAKKLAKNDIINQLIDAMLGGAIAGVGFGGIGSVGGYVTNNSSQKSVGTQVKESGEVKTYVKAGLQAPKGTDVYRFADSANKTMSKGKDISDSEAGRLAIAVEEYIQQNQNVDIRGKGEFKGVDNMESLEEAYGSKKNNLSYGAAENTFDKTNKNYIKTKKEISKSGYTHARAMTETLKNRSTDNTHTEQSVRQKTETEQNLDPEQKVMATKPTIGRTAEGKAISVSDITDIKNGQIFVKTSDGKTQSLKYSDIENAQARKVWQTAAKNFTDPTAAKTFIDNYNGEVVTEYAKAFNDYYQLASTGLSLERIEDMGIAQGNISLAAKVAAVDAGAMSVSFRKGVVDQTTTKKTKMQSLQMRMLDSFGKKYGLNITFVDTLGDYNGFYKPGTNQIVVGLDASEGAVTRTVGHEVYHYIKDANKEGAQKIEDFVLNSLKKLKGEEWVQNKLDSYDKSVYKTEQERIDELVADSMFDVFTNEKTVQEFVKQDRSLAQRVLDRVKTLIADIRNVYNKLIAQGSDEIAALRDELKTLEKIRDLFFEALDETAPAVNQEQKNTAVKLSSKLNTDYMTAVENGDTETAQRLVDEVAKAAGYTYKLYHQTENDFTVFDTNRKGAGTGDYETPFGIFMKPTDSNIGLKGQKQMPLYAKIENPLVASNRENLMYELRDAASVTAVQEEIKKTNNEYKERVEQAGKDLQSYLIEYRKAHPDEPRSEIYNDKGFNEIYNREDSLIEEWTATIDELAVKSKNAITKHLKSNGYDGVIIEEDIGSFGRKTETYIALDNTQVKSADPVTYDNNGNIIPLSERFNDRKVDIRWSKKKEQSLLTREVLAGYNYKGIKVSEQEYSMVSSALMRKNANAGKLKPFVGLFAHDYYYICINHDWGDFTIVKKLNPEIDQELIDYSIGVLRNEEVFTDDIRSLGFFEEFQRRGINRRGRVDLSSDDIGNRRNERKMDEGVNRNGRRSDKRGSVRSGVGNFRNDNEKIILSTKPTNPIREEVSDYINNRSDMQAIYKTIDKRYRIAGKTRLNEKTIKSFANKILSQTHSKYSKELLTERLTALFEFMANSRDFSWDDIMQITAEISKDVLSQSSRLDTSMREEFSDTLKWLKGIDKVYISPEVRAEIDATFGSLDSFRRQIGSRMKITVTDSNAISLDSVWSQLAGDYPGVFDSEITPLDQPAALADFFEMTKPTYQNPYEMDMDEAAYDYALRIYDQYFDIPEVKTEAQKHQLAMDRLRGEFNKKLDAMRNEYKAREQAIRREGKLEADNRVAREKLLNRQRQEAYREKRFETELRQKYRAQILRKLNGITKKLVRPTDSEHIPQELIKSINDFAKTLVGSGAFTSQKADNLKEAFDAIGEAAQNPNFNLASMYDEDIAVKLDNLKKILDGKRFPELTSGELKKVREITDYFAHIVKMSNEAFSESIKERISDLQSDAMDSARNVGSNRKRMETAFQTGLLKPVTFFELLDNPTLEKLYTVIRNGEADWYRVVNNSKNFLQKIKKEHNYKSWKKDTVEFTTERGKTVTLTVGEAMSVYATARRKQGIDHLMKGGIVRESDGAKKIKKLKKDKVNIKGENISLTIKDIQQISSALTDEQKGFANKMVEYLSTDMAELGNERTMRIYGIRKFNESNYFPLRSASNFLYTKPGVQDDARIKHMSMTKKTTPHANNPVIIGDFTEVAMNHCNDMALYYGFVLALEDFTRVYNYKTMDSEGTSQTSVKQQLERAFGKKANSYIMQMLTDINGGVKAQAGANVINKMMSKAKKDAVFASLSVAVQQPSAIARTMLYLNPKYLAKTTFSKRSWNELKEYAPVAGVKEMGYFDANIGRQAVDWMLDEKYEGLIEKAFALFADGNYRDDLLSFLPAYMDRVTWCHIWEAVKAETKAKTDLEVGSKEFLEAAGERFTYIIDRTQVYDSVFSRSEWMRSKDTGMKTVMAFMAEPVTNLNMLYNAAVKARHGDVGFLAKAVSVYAISVAFNSALKALVTAGRDDDDDESFAEKYLAAFISGVVEEPFGMIPYLKDAISLIKGYDSKKMDTQAIAGIVNSISTIFNEDKSIYEKVKAVASAVGMAIGLPVKNVWRDIEMIYNGVTNIVNGVEEPTTKKGITYTLLKEFDSKKFKLLDIPNTAEQYVDAYFEGDQGHLEKTYGNLSEKYEGDEEEINTQIKKALGERYRDGAYTEEQVIEFLEDYFGMDEDEAYWQAQKWKNNENDDWTKYSDFIEALESGENIDEVIEEYYSHGADKSDLASAMSSYYKEEYLSSYESDPSVADEIERKMLAAYKELGYDYDENYIYWKFKEWEGGDEYEKYGEFYDAIDSGNGLNKTINIYLEHGVSKQTLATNITKNYKAQYIELYHTDRAAADRLRRQLVEAYAALGYNRQDKAKDIAKWLE